MIKDIVLHLSADAKHDAAVKYAVSVSAFTVRAQVFAPPPFCLVRPMKPAK